MSPELLLYDRREWIETAPAHKPNAGPLLLVRCGHHYIFILLAGKKVSSKVTAEEKKRSYYNPQSNPPGSRPFGNIVSYE